jgi:hypothetical protein
MTAMGRLWPERVERYGNGPRLQLGLEEWLSPDHDGVTGFQVVASMPR